MDFAYPDTHGDIQNLAGQILNDHCAPDRLKKLEANGAYLDSELWGKVVESGLHAASLPESVGGMGLDFAASMMVAEALGQAVVNIPFIPSIISTALPLASLDDAEANSAVEKAMAGDILTTAHIEPGNDDPLHPSTTVSNGQLNGVKHCVPYAAEATCMLVSAMSGDALWVGLVDTKVSGVTITKQDATTGEPQYEVTFTNAKAHTLATGKAAVALMQKSIAMTTAAYCNMAVGVCTKMTRIACDYTSQRQQFGVAIATFQAVAHRLADCYIDTECLKIITLKATNDISEGDDNAASLSMAKIWCGDALHRISQATQHVHGGAGIDRDYHLWRYCLWAKFLELALGSSRTHLVTLANRLEADYLAESAR